MTLQCNVLSVNSVFSFVSLLSFLETLSKLLNKHVKLYWTLTQFSPLVIVQWSWRCYCITHQHKPILSISESSYSGLRCLSLFSLTTIVSLFFRCVCGLEAKCEWSDCQTALWGWASENRGCQHNLHWHTLLCGLPRSVRIYTRQKCVMECKVKERWMTNSKPRWQ